MGVAQRVCVLLQRGFSADVESYAGHATAALPIFPLGTAAPVPHSTCRRSAASSTSACVLSRDLTPQLVAFVSLLLLSKFSVLKLHIEGCLFDLLGTISTTPCTDSLTRCSSRDGHLALWQSPSDCLQPQSASRADNTNFAIGCQDGPAYSLRRARKTTPLLSPRRLRHAAASLVKDFKSA